MQFNAYLPTGRSWLSHLQIDIPVMAGRGVRRPVERAIKRAGHEENFDGHEHSEARRLSL
jgi:hypothetical protein